MPKDKEQENGSTNVPSNQVNLVPNAKNIVERLSICIILEHFYQVVYKYVILTHQKIYFIILIHYLQFTFHHISYFSILYIKIVYKILKKNHQYKKNIK